MKIRLEVGAGSRLRIEGALDRAWAQYASDGLYEIEVNIEEMAAGLLDERFQAGYAAGYQDGTEEGD